MFLTIRPLLTLLAAAISVFVLPSAQAADRIDCSSLESKILHRAVRYCVEVPSGYDDASLFPHAFRELPRISKPFDQSTLHRVCVSTIGRH